MELSLAPRSRCSALTWCVYDEFARLQVLGRRSAASVVLEDDLRNVVSCFLSNSLCEAPMGNSHGLHDVGAFHLFISTAWLRSGLAAVDILRCWCCSRLRRRPGGFAAPSDDPHGEVLARHMVIHWSASPRHSRIHVPAIAQVVRGMHVHTQTSSTRIVFRMHE